MKHNISTFFAHSVKYVAGINGVYSSHKTLLVLEQCHQQIGGLNR